MQTNTAPASVDDSASEIVLVPEPAPVSAIADIVTQLVPGASNGFAQISNAELLTRTRQLVGKSNQVLAALLEHLAEVETRGLHRTRACASLYTYCIYELRFSEDAAARRASAARLVRRFPAALDAIAKGELHLTGLEKRRFGARRASQRGNRLRRGSAPLLQSAREEGTDDPRQRGGSEKARSRHIPAAKRRAVLERDAGRCTYVDERGQRCRETSHLEIDHVEAFAKGGGDELANLRLRCRAHNALTAEQEFGQVHMRARRHGSRHESRRRAEAQDEVDT